MDRTALEQERDEYLRTITSLETQIRGLRDYITTQERNLRNAAESVRHLTERGLAEARSDLSLKEMRLQQVRQDLLATQTVLGKLNEIARKQQDIQTLERERDRINALLDRAHADLQQLNQHFGGMPRSAPATQFSLAFADGQRIPLPTDSREVLIGCADVGVFPDIDLTPFGGTASGVSRRHALLRFTNGAWTITDLNTTNGTFVNGIKAAPNVPTPLQDGAKLRLGGIDVSFGTQPLPVGKTTRLT